jgi:hypothetical protein
LSGWWNKNRLLMRGHRGADVERLQKALHSWLGITERPDGVFGPITEGRIKEFQRLIGLIEDGKAGPFTQCALLETSYRYALSRPPMIPQSMFTCWAAAIGSATQGSWGTIGVPRKTVADLLSEYDSHLSGDKTNGTWGQLSFQGLDEIGKDLKLFVRKVVPADMRIERFSRALWQTRVSIVLIDDLSGGSIKHARVVYGVHVEKGIFNLMTMDPLLGYTEQDFGTLKGADAVFLVVPRLSRGAAGP